MPSNTGTFSPRNFPVRQPTDNRRRHGAVINPPRFPEVGGATKSNMDQPESELRLSRPKDTR